MIADRKYAFLLPLAADLHLLGNEVKIAEIDPGEFGEPHAGGVEQLEDGEVADVLEPTIPSPRLGGLEEQIDLRAVEPDIEFVLLRRDDQPLPAWDDATVDTDFDAARDLRPSTRASGRGTGRRWGPTRSTTSAPRPPCRGAP